MENLPSFEHARANHAKIDAQKGCAMQLNGITLRADVCKYRPEARNKENIKILKKFTK